jgi:hypothetical protein
MKRNALGDVKKVAIAREFLPSSEQQKLLPCICYMFIAREMTNGSGKVDRKLCWPMLAGEVRGLWVRQGQTGSERKHKKKGGLRYSSSQQYRHKLPSSLKRVGAGLQPKI